MNIKANSLIDEIFVESSLLHAVLSSPREKKTKHKVIIKPVVIKQKIHYQIVEQREAQAFHRNVSSSECSKYLKENIGLNFKQALLCTSEADYHVLAGKEDHVTILKKPPTKSSAQLAHNRQKQYLLQEGTQIPFLIELGIMAHDGRVIAKKNDKFRQLNRFLEMVDDILPNLNTSSTLHIVDFGCGKAYLTFALYYYLVVVKKWNVSIHGLDLKKEVIDHCQALARTLKYDGLNFAVGDINEYQPAEKVDMVISLHACDTATDAALEKAIRWQADVILCVPCCQHELFKQIKSQTLSPLLEHGILKERFSALVTDAARARLLEILGYHTQVLEFIDLEHTPKNLLIRATKKRSSQKNSKEMIQDYITFKNDLKIHPSLESRFQKELGFI
jgi:SAM-dependent methyltransferase